MSSGPTKLERKIKTALDETRLLILGSQILLGFQFNGVFQEKFSGLAPAVRHLQAGALLLMVLALTLLINPSMEHLIVERGRSTRRIFRLAGRMAGAALLPFAISLGIDHVVVHYRLFGAVVGLIVGGVFLVLAIGFWFGLEYLMRRTTRDAVEDEEDEMNTPIAVRVEQMLTEARVILPGAQALLGFQLAVTFTRSFDELPRASMLTHAAALCCVALSVILLMAPAAFHRIAFGGHDNEEFHAIGSRLLIAAAAPLAAGIACDVHVAVAKATHSTAVGLTAAGIAAALLGTLWYARPYLLRRRQAVR